MGYNGETNGLNGALRDDVQGIRMDVREIKHDQGALSSAILELKNSVDRLTDRIETIIGNAIPMKLVIVIIAVLTIAMLDGDKVNAIITTFKSAI